VPDRTSEEPRHIVGGIGGSQGSRTALAWAMVEARLGTKAEAVTAALSPTQLAVKVVKQYEQAALFRLGRVVGVKGAGLKVIVPVIDILHRVSLRIVTMPIQSQGIITRDNVSVDVSPPTPWAPPPTS
jgi:hypothetical protein